MKSKTLVLVVLPVIAYAQADSKSSELAERVARMARIGSVNVSSFSPDGQRLSVISNVSGLPQGVRDPHRGRLATNDY